MQLGSCGYYVRCTFLKISKEIDVKTNSIQELCLASFGFLLSITDDVTKSRPSQAGTYITNSKSCSHMRKENSHVSSRRGGGVACDREKQPAWHCSAQGDLTSPLPCHERWIVRKIPKYHPLCSSPTQTTSQQFSFTKSLSRLWGTRCNDFTFYPFHFCGFPETQAGLELWSFYLSFLLGPAVNFLRF